MKKYVAKGSRDFFLRTHAFYTFYITIPTMNLFSYILVRKKEISF